MRTVVFFFFFCSFACASQASGGLHNDMAVHDFDMARFLVGSEVAEVYCKGSCKVRRGIQSEHEHKFLQGG